MRAPIMGCGIAAVVFCGYLLITYEFPSLAHWSVAGWLFVIAFAAVLVVDYVMKQVHRRSWPSTAGRIEYCRKLGDPRKGAQEYGCAYMYSVDDVRQGGELKIVDKPNKLDEIKSALVGKQITVRYDAHDCTKSIVEETTINGWRVR
jgi:Protein of unknown function (DUF3592)